MKVLLMRFSHLPNLTPVHGAGCFVMSLAEEMSNNSIVIVCPARGRATIRRFRDHRYSLHCICIDSPCRSQAGRYHDPSAYPSSSISK
jgi:hypothetical protein